MFQKRDQEFLALLDDSAKLERRIQDLSRARMWNSVTAAMMMFIVITTSFLLMSMLRSVIVPMGVHQISLPPMLALFPFQVSVFTISLIKAHSTHSELRTLLLFKKLRDTKSVITP